MRTNIDIDEELIARAMELSGAKTKKAAVHEALQWVVDTAKASAARDKRMRAKEQAELKAKRKTRRVK